jgi:hypothetical protein
VYDPEAVKVPERLLPSVERVPPAEKLSDPVSVTVKAAQVSDPERLRVPRDTSAAGPVRKVTVPDTE